MSGEIVSLILFPFLMLAALWLIGHVDSRGGYDEDEDYRRNGGKR